MKRDSFLIFGAPRFFQEELKEMLETLRSGWWGTGPKVLKFEEDFKKLKGIRIFCYGWQLKVYPWGETE